MLFVEIIRFCRRTGMPPTTFGRLAAHDPHLVRDLRQGREVGNTVVARVRRFMSEHHA